MINKINDYFLENKQYGKRNVTDKVLYYPEYSRSFKGIADASFRIIQQWQLMDKSLWKLFVNQYRECPDDTDHGWRGEFWGKMMRGACLSYQYSKDEELYKILTDSTMDMLSTVDEYGRFSTYSLGIEFHEWDMWCRKYVLLGFLHYHEICTDKALKDTIEAAMCKHLDYIISKVGEGKIDITSTSNIWEGVNSSSILEPVMRMYNLTQKKDYLDFATYIVNRGGADTQNIFETAYEGKLYPYQYKVVKAYETMSCFEGLCEYYRATGIEKWKTAVINFWDLLSKTDITVIGCSGCTHELFDNSAAEQTDKERTDVMQETCVTVTWMKLCMQLLLMTGEEKYANEIEKSAYNALYGSINTMKTANNGGLPFDSYSPLLLNKRGLRTGGYMAMKDGAYYGCCASIGSVGTAILPDYAFMASEDGTYISFYEAGKVQFPVSDDNMVEYQIKTEYPVDGKIEITLFPEKETCFSLFLRIPSFSKNTRLCVNGKELECECGSYKEIKSKWNKGDQIVIEFDMTPIVSKAPGCKGKEDSFNYICVKRGPLMLARDRRICMDAGERLHVAANIDSVTLVKTNKADFDTLCEFEAAFPSGEKTTLIDYQSAGKTWDMDSATEVWLPVSFDC